MLAPALGALLGERLLGALAVVLATWLFGLLAGRRAALLIVPALLATVVSGRVTFALGAAAGIAAVLAAVRGRIGLAAAGGVLTALASPVAALFAGIAGAALVLGDRERRAPGLALGAGAAAVTLVLVVAFPEGGTFPFVASAFWPAFALGIAVAALASDRRLRTGGALYALLCLAVFVVPSPIGGNAARLGALLVAPVAVTTLWPRRRAAVLVLAPLLAYWVLYAPVRDVVRAHGDPATQAAFHAPLLDALARRADLRSVRIEVPLTQNHGEASHLARRVAIARGWERQVDRDRNALFYRDGLDAERYRRWLDENAIAYVALPLGVPFDPAGADEAALVRHGLPYLREVARPPGWRLFAVRDPAALGADRLDPDGFTVTGSSLVRVRYSPYFAPVSGHGCVEPGPGGWTRVRAQGPERVIVRARFAVGRVRATSPRCR